MAKRRYSRKRSTRKRTSKRRRSTRRRSRKRSSRRRTRKKSSRKRRSRRKSRRRRSSKHGGRKRTRRRTRKRTRKRTRRRTRKRTRRRKSSTGGDKYGFTFPQRLGRAVTPTRFQEWNIKRKEKKSIDVSQGEKEYVGKRRITTDRAKARGKRALELGGEIVRGLGEIAMGIQ